MKNIAIFDNDDHKVVSGYGLLAGYWMNAENEIWGRWVNGDNDALEIIYRRYFADLFTYGLKVHPDPSLVKDAIQEIFIDLIKQKDRLQVSGTIHLYLFKALRHKITEELRTKNRKSEIARSIAGETEVTDPNIEYHIEIQETLTERQKVMQNALSKLSAHQREAIYLKFTQSMEYDDIARITGIDVASVRTLVYRSLKKVRELIGKNLMVLLWVSLRE